MPSESPSTPAPALSGSSGSVAVSAGVSVAPVWSSTEPAGASAAAPVCVSMVLAGSRGALVSLRGCSGGSLSLSDAAGSEAAPEVDGALSSGTSAEPTSSEAQPAAMSITATTATAAGLRRLVLPRG